MTSLLFILVPQKGKDFREKMNLRLRSSILPQREEMISCCIGALRFYGGSPKAIVSDNLNSAVNRSSKYEADVNRSFKDFARRYNCVINPTRSYSPQDKALVEPKPGRLAITLLLSIKPGSVKPRSRSFLL